jgi:hypothetical protein
MWALRKGVMLDTTLSDVWSSYEPASLGGFVPRGSSGPVILFIDGVRAVRCAAPLIDKYVILLLAVVQ